MALLPQDSWIGVLGGGQLGRMLAIEARRMGYHVVQWVGGVDSGPAGIADIKIETPFDCGKSLEEFIARVDVVTVEFENIPGELLNKIESRLPLYPSSRAIGIAQHREREKTFLRNHDIPCAPFEVIASARELELANQSLQGDSRVLKTAEFGYDGKGQISFPKTADVESIWSDFSAPRAVLEQKIDLEGECSVLVARNPSGETAVYDPAENIHTNHILDLSIVPARFPSDILDQARELAVLISQKLDYIGLLAVEFFISTGGSIMVNELAPRPHNSGHHTLDACYTSQFEQQLRAICDIPLGKPDLKSPVVMWNLLGDLWPEMESAHPDWNIVFQEPGASLHLYGKREARKGRKMGHVNFTGDNQDALIQRAEAVATRMGWKR